MSSTTDVDETEEPSDESVTLADLVSAVRRLVRVTKRVEKQLRSRTWILVSTVIVVAAWIGYLATNQQRLHRVVDGDCRFYQAIGTLPVPATGATALHQIVDNARAAYEARCDQFGRLGPVQTYVPPTPTVTPTS